MSSMCLTSVLKTRSWTWLDLHPIIESDPKTCSINFRDDWTWFGGCHPCRHIKTWFVLVQRPHHVSFTFPEFKCGTSSPMSMSSRVISSAERFSRYWEIVDFGNFAKIFVAVCFVVRLRRMFVRLRIAKFGVAVAKGTRSNLTVVSLGSIKRLFVWTRSLLRIRPRIHFAFIQYYLIEVRK